MAVILAIFLYTLYYADGYDEGNEYVIRNGHYNTLSGIVPGLASNGVKKVIVIFNSLLSIAIVSLL